jgi:hypothetical protein
MEDAPVSRRRLAAICTACAAVSAMLAPTVLAFSAYEPFH